MLGLKAAKWTDLRLRNGPDSFRVLSNLPSISSLPLSVVTAWRSIRLAASSAMNNGCNTVIAPATSAAMAWQKPKTPQSGSACRRIVSGAS
jgi:hypothetical protein